MVDEFPKQSGGGRSPGLRRPGIRRGTWVSCWLLGLIVGAAPAWAAEIVEVRVGRHPEFTRVVFELDRAAGYRIERSDASAEVPELIVSLEASSIPRRIRSQKTLIEQVEVEPSGRRAVAHIRLAKGDLRLKEMILANPPRIVLDVSSDEPAVARTTTTPAPAKTAAAPTSAGAGAAGPERAEPSFEDVVAQVEREARTSGAAVEGAARMAAAETSDSVREATAAADAKAERLRRKAEKAERKAAAAAAQTAGTAEALAGQAGDAARGALADAGDAADRLADAAGEAAIGAGEAIDAMAEDAGEGLAAAGAGASDSIDSSEVDAVLQGMAGARPQARDAQADAERAQPTKAAQAAKPRPMVAKEEESGGSGWMTWGLAAVGGVVVLLGGLIALRRRGGEEIDFEAEDAPSLDDDDMPVSAEAGNPFADLAGEAEQPTLTGLDEATVGPFGSNLGGGAALPADDEEKESESIVFDDSEESSMDDMEVISRDQVNEALGSAMPPMGGIPEEFQQMMREMARRVEALEARCDELVDARDRLERQVAAQTEELRVQRAAIARTQRAVRNLARPGEGGEEEATEPALRDPNGPGSAD